MQTLRSRLAARCRVDVASPGNGPNATPRACQAPCRAPESTEWLLITDAYFMARELGVTVGPIATMDLARITTPSLAATLDDVLAYLGLACGLDARTARVIGDTLYRRYCR